MELDANVGGFASGVEFSNGSFAYLTRSKHIVSHGEILTEHVKVYGILGVVEAVVDIDEKEGGLGRPPTLVEVIDFFEEKAAYKRAMH